jgi:hypothetical protein
MGISHSDHEKEVSDFWNSVYQMLDIDPPRAMVMAYERGWESALEQCQIHIRAGVPIPRPGGMRTSKVN